MSAKLCLAKFRVGRIVSTHKALGWLTFEDIHNGITRHQAGDWGEGEHDANERALVEGLRLWSVYRTSTGVKFWIITESNRQTTTVLLPEDY